MPPPHPVKEPGYFLQISVEKPQPCKTFLSPLRLPDFISSGGGRRQKGTEEKALTTELWLEPPYGALAQERGFSWDKVAGLSSADGLALLCPGLHAPFSALGLQLLNTGHWSHSAAGAISSELSRRKGCIYVEGTAVLFPRQLPFCLWLLGEGRRRKLSFPFQRIPERFHGE